MYVSGHGGPSIWCSVGRGRVVSGTRDPLAPHSALSCEPFPPPEDLEPFQEPQAGLHGRKASLPLPHASRNCPSWGRAAGPEHREQVAGTSASDSRPSVGRGGRGESAGGGFAETRHRLGPQRFTPWNAASRAAGLRELGFVSSLGPRGADPGEGAAAATEPCALPPPAGGCLSAPPWLSSTHPHSLQDEGQGTYR